MTNTLNKIIHNGDEYEFPVTSVNWQTGDVTVEPGITKIFTLPSDLTSQEALTNAQAAYDWRVAWGIAVVQYVSTCYFPFYKTSGYAWFTTSHALWAVTVGTATSWSSNQEISLSLSSWTVTSITSRFNAFYLSNRTPTLNDNNRITFVL